MPPAQPADPPVPRRATPPQEEALTGRHGEHTAATTATAAAELAARTARRGVVATASADGAATPAPAKPPARRPRQPIASPWHDRAAASPAPSTLARLLDARLDAAVAAELGDGTLTADLASALDFANRAKADNTRRAYAADLADLEAYCRHHEVPLPLPLPPAVLGAYLSACARLRPPPALATLARRLAAMRKLHELNGFKGLDNPGQHPDLLRVWQGIRNQLTWSQEQAAPAATAEIRRMVEACPDHLYIGVRDKALLLLGYALLTRRSELVHLDVEDLVLVEQGLVATVWRRKTDPEGKDVQLVAIPYGTHLVTCPVRAWLAWRDAAGLQTGAAFRPVHPRARLDSPDATAIRAQIQAVPRLRAEKVSLLLKRAAQRAGFPDWPAYSGHSPRRGAAVELRRRARATDIEIAEAGGWRNLDQVRRYTRLAALWEDPPAGRLGL